MKSPRVLFCERKQEASAAVDAIGSDVVQQAIAAAFAQVAWSLGSDPSAQHKLAGIRAFIDALNVVGIPPAGSDRAKVGALTVLD